MEDLDMLMKRWDFVNKMRGRIALLIKFVGLEANYQQIF